jgi:nucleotide-binding universal stress UspA family protein
MTFEKILVPLDGSLFAEAALPKAVELIRHNSRATLILLRAAEATTCLGVDPTDAQVRVVHEAEEYLETVAARLREDHIFEVKTSVWYGAPAWAILEAARITNPDLIMMGTHGRTGIERLIVGSVAESVVRGTRTPLFLIRVDGTRLGTPLGRTPAREPEAANV